MNEQQRFPDPSEIRHQIGATGQLTINNVSGSIEIRASDTDEAVVVARSEGGASEGLPLTVRKTDGGLHIDVEKKNSFSMFGAWFGTHPGIDFDVTVPRAARVSINSVSADVRSHSLSGEQTFKTVSGDVELDADGGRVRVTTVSGDIQVRTGGPAELSASSTSGDVRVKGATLTAFEARTVSGDVRLQASLAAGPLHSVETVSGDLSVEATTGVTVDVRRGMDFNREGSTGLVTGDGAAQLRFRTLSGDCYVEGARRVDRSGWRDRKFERRIERHAGRLARRMSPEEMGFTGMPPMPPMPPMHGNSMPPMPGDPMPATPSAPRAPESAAVDQLEVLRALERGEIDVEEASRRLQEA